MIESILVANQGCYVFKKADYLKLYNCDKNVSFQTHQ